MSEAYAITCCQMDKAYGAGEFRVEVLKDLEFNVKPGENVAIVGASGSGKSTLLHLLGGLDLPDTGTITINHDVINEMSEDERCTWRGKMIGFIYQFHYLLSEFTVLENVCMPLFIANSDSKAAQQRALDLLEKVNLIARLQHKPDELSGGERQRVAICRALVASPAIVLADEPTGNLDRENGLRVMAEMMKLNRDNGSILIVATHDLEITQHFDRVIRLVNGKVLTEK